MKIMKASITVFKFICYFFTIVSLVLCISNGEGILNVVAMSLNSIAMTLNDYTINDNKFYQFKGKKGVL